MHTLGELADELNRQEWAVERMLKNRGYLKNNGDMIIPREKHHQIQI